MKIPEKLCEKLDLTDKVLAIYTVQPADAGRKTTNIYVPNLYFTNLCNALVEKNATKTLPIIIEMTNYCDSRLKPRLHITGKQKMLWK